MPEHIFNCMQYAHAVAQCYNVTGCIFCTMLQVTFAHCISEKTIWRDNKGLVPWVAACLCRYWLTWHNESKSLIQLGACRLRPSDWKKTTWAPIECTIAHHLRKKQFSTQATWKHNIWGHTTWAQRFVKDDLWPVKNALLVLSDCCTST